MTKKRRNIAQEVADSLKEIQNGAGKRIEVEMPDGVRLVRAKTGLSQSEFAKQLNISVRTLQEWEQGRTNPTGAAVSLLNIVGEHPELFIGKGYNESGTRAH